MKTILCLLVLLVAGCVVQPYRTVFVPSHWERGVWVQAGYR